MPGAGLRCLCGSLVTSRWVVPASVVLLLATHAGLLAWSATRHSPTLNEPGHLVAGLSHWTLGRFEVYCVNPPLVHYVAAIPVIAAGYNEDWSRFRDSPGARSEFELGWDFIKANGPRSIWLFTMARWACIPFSLIGGLFCFFWSRELWGSSLAGLISLTLWCFDPNILAHGELVTSDCAASALGLGAGYFFWRWLKHPAWGRALAAGAMMGLALLTKTSWIILFGLWPALWICWVLMEWRMRPGHASSVDSEPARADLPSTSILHQSGQLGCLLLLALYLVNLGYGFAGSLTLLKDFTFVSKALTGLSKAGMPGNRFQDSWLGDVAVPVPRSFLQGIDLQKKDFEDYGQPSYLRGEWKAGGWWYYYLYGLAVKVPHGSQLILVLALFTLIYYRRRSPARSVAAVEVAGFTATPGDLVVLLVPAMAVLVLISSQLEFNHHIRYALPVLGFGYVFAGIVGRWFSDG